MGRTAFVVGAGFAVDAGPEVGPIHVEYSLSGPFDFECHYPLVKDLIALCYPERSNEACPSVEEWFHESLQSGDRKPLRRLYETLMKADYYLVPALIASAENQRSSYGRFLEKFRAADFITFNYDCFIEAALLRFGRWIPTVGFGLPVFAARMNLLADGVEIPSSSENLVLHIHGSLCVYESHFSFSEPDKSGVRWLKQKPETEFIFDPDSLGHLFVPWERVIQPLLGADRLEDCVIAPVPEKAAGLKREFVMKVRERASKVISTADVVVAVRYSFNPVDDQSFGFLLRAIKRKGNPTLIVVSPSAEATIERLAETSVKLHLRRYLRLSNKGRPATLHSREGAA